MTEATHLSQDIKNERVSSFWERENKRHNYDKSRRKFETLHSQSDYEEWEEFMDNYLIDLYNNRTKLTNKEFTVKY